MTDLAAAAAYVGSGDSSVCGHRQSGAWRKPVQRRRGGAPPTLLAASPIRSRLPRPEGGHRVLA
jgi:hypothetical protein